MKGFFRITGSLLLLFAITSCGGGDDENTETISREKRGEGRKCYTRTTGEAWKEFVENVKSLNFADFSTYNCWESSWNSKGPNCKTKGWLYLCDGTRYYNKPVGSTPCQGGGIHEAALIKLVTARPNNFEAEFCGDDVMVRAKIAVSGVGQEDDQYHFDFEVPASHNPVFKKVWRDSDRRYTVTVRQ